MNAKESVLGEMGSFEFNEIVKRKLVGGLRTSDGEMDGDVDEQKTVLNGGSERIYPSKGYLSEQAREWYDMKNETSPQGWWLQTKLPSLNWHVKSSAVGSPARILLVCPAPLSHPAPPQPVAMHAAVR